jgi:hypothetical protein
MFVEPSIDLPERNDLMMAMKVSALAVEQLSAIRREPVIGDDPWLAGPDCAEHGESPGPKE